MLRKRSRSHQKDQNLGHPMAEAFHESNIQYEVLRQKHKTSSFFTVPGLFVGLSPKASESDSVRSPTSPLDFMVFSTLTNPSRSPIMSHEGNPKSWDCSKVGLSIIDSLEDDDAKESGKIIRSSQSKSILFGSQMRIKTPNFRNHIDSFEAPKSLPKSFGVSSSTQIKPSNLQMARQTKVEPEPFGKILSYSLDSGRSGSHLINRGYQFEFWDFNSSSRNGTNPLASPPQLREGSQDLGNSSAAMLNPLNISLGSARDLTRPLSASEIELSEDYTCVKTYGPNPTTTHIFGDCILECHNNNLSNSCEKIQIQWPLAMAANSSKIRTSYPSSDFLKFCYSCKKKLDGEDIYMYRGEKAFCSWDCRSQEIMIEEAMEEETTDACPQNSPKSNPAEELSRTTMFIAK
ncbi:LOW QUALITY PROTEIN: FCS-Like Zinc finger 11-like [Diospyros lotus]|uniref:LOW QUALITY PROTEIN: FCS-Like Zinc finger 11-like n=1 Tax=Diospyros lotus TaxID=55363 RepID=UPI00225B15B0|nr:LOW QUALITY PROTEIN: FCS-Like Zinc finger 11-like [Diospyros lotus]